MNAIIGLTTIAEKKLGDQEAVAENLRKISLASNHLLTLINDILDISKVESGKLNLSPLTFSIVETVQNLMNLYQPMVKEKNIDFSIRINQIVKEYLYADQLRLNQIYINILSNAIKYTMPGGSVSVDLREEESEKEGCVKLIYCVADTGIGMSPEFLEKMYQPFSRQTDSRVNSIQGTGLGLAITRQELNKMASAKRLVTPTTDLSFDAVYEPFSQVPAERVLSPEVIGITDAIAKQVRNAAYQVGSGAITIDEAVSQYGSSTD